MQPWKWGSAPQRVWLSVGKKQEEEIPQTFSFLSFQFCQCLLVDEPNCNPKSNGSLHGQHVGISFIGPDLERRLEHRFGGTNTDKPVVMLECSELSTVLCKVAWNLEGLL